MGQRRRKNGVQVTDARLAKRVDAADGVLGTGVVVDHLRAEQIRQRAAQAVSRHPQLSLRLPISNKIMISHACGASCVCRVSRVVCVVCVVRTGGLLVRVGVEEATG